MIDITRMANMIDITCMANMIGIARMLKTSIYQKTMEGWSASMVSSSNRHTAWIS
jgi:hypothetical protein